MLEYIFIGISFVLVIFMWLIYKKIDQKKNNGDDDNRQSSINDDDFKKNIILPCIELCNTSKFEFEDERWLSTTYEESLAGCKFHLPYKTSVESRLSRHGNVRRKIFLCLYYLL